MATTKEQVAAIYRELGPAEQRQVETVIAQKGWGAALGSAIVLKQQRHEQQVAMKQISAPVGSLGQEMQALHDAIRQAQPRLGEEAIALEVRHLRTHIEGMAATAGAPMRKEVRQKSAQNAFDALLSGAGRAAGAMAQEAQDQREALGMYNDPWYR